MGSYLNYEWFSRLGREFLWITSGQTLAVLGAIVGVRILTGVLSAPSYGELALGMTAATLINQVILGPLSNVALRFYSPSQEAGELGAYLAALRGLLSRSFLITACWAVVVCSPLLAGGYHTWFWLGITAFGFALVSGSNSVLDGIQNAARQRAVVAWHNGTGSWLKFLGAAVMVIWLGDNSAITMSGYLLAAVMVLFSQLWFFKKRILRDRWLMPRSEMNISTWHSRMLGYAMPFALWGTFTFAQMASDRWALQLFCTTQDVGLYAVLYQLGYTPLTLLTGVMVQLVAPVFFQRAGDATDERRMWQVYAWNRRLTWAALVGTLATALLAASYHECLFRFLVAPGYRSVSWLLPGMVLSGGFFAVSQFAVISLLSGIESRVLLTPKVVTALGGVLLNFLLAAWQGLPGVVAANVLFSTGYLIWILFLVSSHVNRTLVLSGAAKTGAKGS